MGRPIRGNSAPLARKTGAARPWAEALEERIALAVFTVTNTLDDINPGSLRRAIIDANSSLAPDTIVFDPAVFSTPRTITIFSPPTPPQITNPLTIIGPGANLLTVTRSSTSPSGRVFDSFASTLSISDMTITGPNGGGLGVFGIAPNATLERMVFTGCVAPSGNGGGGIFLNNSATLTIRDSTLTNNRALVGGGIMFFQNGSLLMERCTVSGNAATTTGNDVTSGGGIYFSGTAAATPPAGFTPGTLVVRDSTISGNTSSRGGGGIGVDTFTGTLLVQNCTVSGNTAATLGGGVAVTGGTGTVTLQNCTVTANAANGTATNNGGGGVARFSTVANTLNLINTVVSGNTHAISPDVRTDAFTTTNVTSSAVGSPAGFTMSGSSANNLPFGVNPLLGPLASNGGPTLTRALLPGSPLINAGSNARVPADQFYDQRGLGFPRIAGISVDIGAFELPAPPKVAAVFVRGTAWGLGFRQFVQARGLGESAVGYSIPGGADQLKTLPWINMDTVSIRFTQDVTVVAGNLSMRGVNVANYAFSNFQYEPVTHTGIWTLAQPLRKDKVLLDLDGDAGGVSAGGSRLDGEWADGGRAFPSGNDTPGGDFRFRFNSLPGDVDRSGSVLATDYSAVKLKFFSSAAAPGSGAAGYTIFHDVNANGTILADDFSAVKSRFFDSLPGAEPSGVARAVKSPFYVGSARVADEVLA